MCNKLLIIFYLFGFTNVVAQQNTAAFNLHQYTTENGLPSNLIRGIQWDDNTGFLWVVTEGGLVRLNGVEFKSYNKEKISPIAPEKQVYAVQNNHGNIFISDGSGNIFAVKENKPVLAKSSSTSNSFINYHFIAVSDTFFTAKINQPPVFEAPFEKLICLSDTSCLLLFQNILYRYSISLTKAAPVLHNITAIFKIGNNCFFTDNNRQIFLLNTNTFAATPVNFFAADKQLLNFSNGSSQLFWQTGMDKPIVIKDNKAWLFNLSGNTISTALITDALPTDANISCVGYQEKNKMLFIGTDSKGIIIITENLVHPKKRKNANPKNKNAYFSQIALDNGNVLTNEGDVIGDNNTAIPLPVAGKFSHRISLTNNNLLWFYGNNSKLGIRCFQQYNKTTGETKAFPKIRLLSQVDTVGDKIYLSNNTGIGILEGDSIRYLHQYAKEAGIINIYDFKTINKEQFLIAGCNGLFRFTVTTNKLDTVYKRGDACFGSIWKYKDYIFWGSYGYGYYIYKNGVIKEMPLDKNEYLLYCHCFVEDAYGFCWISTNRGLFKVKLEEIIANFEDGRTPIYYHYFGRKDGIEMTELNGGCTPCALTLKDGTLSFPSMDGLLWVNPTAANPVLPSGDIYIDEILVDSKAVEPDLFNSSKLSSDVQEIIFKLGFSAWCNKENLYIDYQLNDTLNWKRLKAEDNSFIQFNNLGPGKYVLRIRKLNGFGINNYSYKKIEFTITTPWYKKWWFYLLLLTLLFGIIVLFFEWRTRQYKHRQAKLEMQVADKTTELRQKNEVLEKNDSIKTRLISIISHDIVTPLKFLTVAGKNLVEKRKQMPEELQQETITEMANTSQELQLLSTNILNWIKYQNENRRLAKENFNVHEMVNQVFGVLKSIAKQKNIALLNSVDELLTIQQYFEPLKILLHNLVSNAINFSEKGIIEITSSITKEHIIVTVKDEGVGMTQEQIKNIMADKFIISSANIDNRKGNGLGYLIIKDLLKTMEASVKIESEKGKGTAVAIIIPV